MFQEWGFLISEMALLIILAALLGLIVGWIIWGRRAGAAARVERLERELETCRKGARNCETDLEKARAELTAAKGDLETCRTELAASAAPDGAAAATGGADIAAIRAELDACRAETDGKDRQIAELEREVKQAEALAEAAEMAAMEAAAESVAVAEAVEADHGLHPVHPGSLDQPAQDPDAKDYDGDGVIEGTDEGVKPATLAAARGGAPDDLKQIKGIGPKLEQLCHELGFFHFDQLAAWTPAEVAWVDANLKGFKGRVSRDNWVDQARTLAAGGTTEFSKKVKKGGVYD